MTAGQATRGTFPMRMRAQAVKSRDLVLGDFGRSETSRSRSEYHSTPIDSPIYDASPATRRKSSSMIAMQHMRRASNRMGLKKARGWLSKKIGLGHTSSTICNIHALTVKHVNQAVSNKLFTLAQIAIPAAVSILAFFDPAPLSSDRRALYPLDLRYYDHPNVLTTYYTSMPKTQALSGIYKGLFDPGTTVVRMSLTDEGQPTLEMARSRRSVTIIRVGEDNDLKYLTPGEERAFAEYYQNATRKEGLYRFNRKHAIGSSFSLVDDTVYCWGFYNPNVRYSELISMQYLSNAYVKFVLGKDHDLQMSYSPISTDRVKSIEVTYRDTYNEAKYRFTFVTLGLCVSLALFTYAPCLERQAGTKHLQTIFGVSSLTYWSCRILYDAVIYFVTVTVCMSLFLASKHGEYYRELDRVFILCLIHLAHGMAEIAANSIIIFLVEAPGSAVAITMIWMNIECVILDFIISGFKMNAGKVYNFTTYVLPKIALTNATYFMDVIHASELCKRLDNDCETNNALPCCPGCKATICMYDMLTETYLQWDRPGIGKLLAQMAGVALVCFSIVVILDSSALRKARQSFHSWLMLCLGCVDDDTQSPILNEDSDVADERENVAYLAASGADSLKEEPLVVMELSKNYCRHRAVDHISFSLSEGQCFGLLGLNGAGKTTVFKMLTQEERITKGDAYIHGYSVCKNPWKAIRHVGYCPQSISLLSSMTVRETLIFYCRLRAFSKKDTRTIVYHLMVALTLLDYRHALVENLSGGNKRKCSVGIAVIGLPSLILLDEPSAGMDPLARRSLWTVLTTSREAGSNLVLTSHSMDECEALCTKLVFMINGSFLCLGTQQHLKTRFTQGFTIVATIKKEEMTPTEVRDARTRLITYIQDSLSTAQVFEQHDAYVHFQVPATDVSVADVFEVMETTKSRDVLNYTVQQTTLEQLFLSFTKGQKPPKSTNKICSWCIGDN